MIPKELLKYRGDFAHRVTGLKRHSHAPPEPVPYVAKPELVEAVNLAIYAGRPLLLEGEAGCGKSTLALAVADELGLPFFRWNVRSASKAQEGLYMYDPLRRLHDNQLKATDSNARTSGNPANPMNYVTFGALGSAFRTPGVRSVVLIDEIDKADVDFPNDLLTVLDEPWAFEIPEAGGRRIEADRENRPIVFVTSNKERGNLPGPFLRRCVYSIVPFPGEVGELERIVETHKLGLNKALVKASSNAFRKIREDKELFKNPGTSEFIDWVKALGRFGKTSKDLAKGVVPYPQLLFKMRPDLMRHLSAR